MSSKSEKHAHYIPLRLLGNFPADWAEMSMADVCTQVTDGTHDSPKPVDVGGFPLVTGKAIKNRQINFDNTYKISAIDHYKVIERSKAETDDILIANIGNSIGDLVRVSAGAPEFSIKNVALLKPNTHRINPRYLEYYLLSDVVQSYIQGLTKGSAQPFIGLGTLRTFPVAVPPMQEQVSIGRILGCLDDSIAILRETNTTLEAVATQFLNRGSWILTQFAQSRKGVSRKGWMKLQPRFFQTHLKSQH